MHGEALRTLASALRDAAWELALACVDEGLREESVPSLARLGRIGQLGDLPTFISELARELAEPQPGRMRRGSPLAALARDHARQREMLGFAPREIVGEFLLLRRVLWRFVSQQAAELGADDLLVAEQRLNSTIDSLIAECVVAYFERATSELAHRARHDALTGLLNPEALRGELELQLERAKRYGHGLALVFFDIDDFKRINDEHGHPEGDRVLRVVAQVLRSSLRSSDLAGRMGGDEFAAVLVESDPEAAAIFLERLHDRLADEEARATVPARFGVSPGLGHYPSEGQTVEELFRLADRRLYEVKRRKA